jgi:hypothetical protein
VWGSSGYNFLLLLQNLIPSYFSPIHLFGASEERRGKFYLKKVENTKKYNLAK